MNKKVKCVLKKSNNKQKYLFFVFLLLFFNTSFAQFPQKITIHAADEMFENLIEIYQFPAEELHDKSQSAWLGFKKTNDEIGLLFKNSDTTFWLSSTLILDEEIAFGADLNVFFDNNLIKIETRQMRGIIFGTAFSLQNDSLLFVEKYDYDLNEAVYRSADEAIKENNPLKYCQAYEQAQYYTDYPYRIHEALLWADSLALAFFKQKKYEEAANLMLFMQNDCFFSTSETISDNFPDDFQKIWGNATLYYLKAKKYEECENLCKIILEKFPHLTAVYLQYADALFEKNNKIESVKLYNIYIDKMKKEGKKSKIPNRVTQRCRY